MMIHTNSNSSILIPTVNTCIPPQCFKTKRKLTAAFPPEFRISIPHLAAKGCVQATMPLVLWTTLLRLGHFIKAAEADGNTDGVVSGIVSLYKAAAKARGCAVFGSIYYVK